MVHSTQLYNVNSTGVGVYAPHANVATYRMIQPKTFDVKYVCKLYTELSRTATAYCQTSRVTFTILLSLSQFIVFIHFDHSFKFDNTIKYKY